MGNKREHPKVQHYVPRCLLRNFTDAADRVHVFDKRTEKEFTVSPEGVAAESGFYDFKTADGQAQSLEAVMGRLEGTASPVIKSILQKKSLAPLSNQDRVTLCLFAAVQHLRVKALRERLKALYVGVRNEILNRGIDPGDVMPAMDDDAMTRETLLLIGTAKRIAKILFEKPWVLLAAPEGTRFWLSDNPVTLHRLVDLPGHAVEPLATPGLEIYLPLSKDFCLMFLCPSVHREVLCGLAYAGHFELRFGSFPVEVASLQAFARAIAEGTPDFMLPDNVNHINSLQVQRSSRFIISAARDFELAKTMLKANPRLREPPGFVIS